MTQAQRDTDIAGKKLVDVGNTLCMASCLIGAENEFLRNELMIAMKETTQILTDAALSVSFAVEDFDDDEEYAAWMREVLS